MADEPDPAVEAAQALGVPYALAKATVDPFDYALGTRDGRIIRFHEATMKPGDAWIFLHGFGQWADHGMDGTDFTLDRGIYVRVADIVWVADAPRGS